VTLLFAINSTKPGNNPNPPKKISLPAGGMVNPPKQAGGMFITTQGIKKKLRSSIS
jgi:hypothetical protein